MVYWSTHRIPPIRKESSGVDVVLSVYPKEYSNVTAYAAAATGYSMLAHMLNGANDSYVNMMQKFLQEQHMWVGGFASTQDTLIAMQALKTLAERNQDRTTYEISFQFRSDQVSSWEKAITINQKNWFDAHEVDVSIISLVLNMLLLNIGYHILGSCYPITHNSQTLSY